MLFTGNWIIGQLMSSLTQPGSLSDEPKIGCVGDSAYTKHRKFQIGPQSARPGRWREMFFKAGHQLGLGRRSFQENISKKLSPNYHQKKKRKKCEKYNDNSSNTITTTAKHGSSNDMFTKLVYTSTNCVKKLQFARIIQ